MPSTRRSVAPERSLAQNAPPEVLAQWHTTKNGDLTPADVTVASHSKVWWICAEGHEWETKVSQRTKSKPTGCPVCYATNRPTGYRAPRPGQSLAENASPNLLSQWHPEKNGHLTPSDVTTKSGQKAWWLCAEGHTFEALISNRSNGSGCPVCSGNNVFPGVNDLATTHPELAAQWHPAKNERTANSVAADSSGKAWWKCARGHEWEALIGSRTRAKTKCPYCSGRLALLGETDLATTHPFIAQQWNYAKNVSVTPQSVTARSVTRVWWTCAFSHAWEATIHDVVRRGRSCPVCTARKVLSGFNDLASKFPEVASQWHSEKNHLNVEEVSYKSSQPAWWLCERGHEWQTRVWDRTRADNPNGCPNCAYLNNSSRGEESLAEWIESMTPNVKRHDRSLLSSHELDIYLPDHKFAIEYNGVYWHSEAAGKSRDYHLRKTQACEEQNVTLFQVWEDDWRDRNEIVKRMLLHRLSLSQEPVIYARKTAVTTLPSAQARAFLEKYHIQGAASGGLYLGLEEKSSGAIVAVMVFKRMANRVVYLERYATARRVPGGFTKLLKRAIEILQPGKVVTFADRSISQGDLYENHGFTKEKVLDPDYSYLIRNERVHKFNYRIKRFREDPSLLFEEGLTETELARLNKLARVWDSGKIRYVLTV